MSFGIISSVFASTYDDESNIIIADGNGMDETNGNNFVSDPDTAVIVSGTLTNIRATLVALYDYIADPSSHSGGVSALKTKLANIQSLKLDIQGDAEITPNDLGYITFLTNYVGNDSAQVDVNVTGNVTFGSGTNDYIDDEIADVKTSNFTLSADKTITLPYGSDIESFF
ncbi:MAG: hypothetical protein LBU14_01320 [Candidatus Peribacteria bacterium]|nr:hypothetical protein [Candidatus Peribacteria bacterium]